MIKALEKKMMKQNGQAVKYIKPIALNNFKGKIYDINKQIDRDFGLAGPLTLSTPSLRVHSVRWATSRESYIIETNVKRVLKEIVAASISKTNKCTYCSDAHTTSIVSLGDNLTSQKIIDGTWKEINDEKTKNIINWALNTRNPNAEIIKNPPFTKNEVAEIIGTALVFHSTNRFVSIFLEDSPLPQFLSGRLKKMSLKMASKTLFKTMVSKNGLIGESLKFIENYESLNNFKWANNVPSYQKALTAEQVALDEIESEIIPPNIAKLFKEKISSWNGESMPLGRSWLQEITQSLNENEKSIANLIFLSAFEPHTITENEIIEFRKLYPKDKELIEVCFWAIQIITNRISEWLTKPFH